MRKLFLIISLLFFYSCQAEVAPLEVLSMDAHSIIERINPPSGYTRNKASQGSWGAYLQNFPLKAAGSKVLDYKGKPIMFQEFHSAVLDIDIGEKDLQQCADAAIRLRAEYLWLKGLKDQVVFEFTSGHKFAWDDYAEGTRSVVSGNKVSFEKKAQADHSYESFRRYLDVIFMYAGTISLHKEMKKVDRNSEYEIGDVIIHPGSPGHAVIIVDKAKNAQGKYIYLLAQGYTPAQSIHIVKSGHSGISPWFDIPKTGTIYHERFYLSNAGVRRFY